MLLLQINYEETFINYWEKIYATVTWGPINLSFPQLFMFFKKVMVQLWFKFDLLSSLLL